MKHIENTIENHQKTSKTHQKNIQQPINQNKPFKRKPLKKNLNVFI